MRSLIPLKKTIAKLEPIPDMSDEIASKKYDLDHYQHKLRRTLPELLSAAQETKAILHEYHDVL